jgi:hypothetical protein
LPQFGQVTGGHGSSARAAAVFVLFTFAAPAFVPFTLVLLMSVIRCKAHTLTPPRAFRRHGSAARLDARRIRERHVWDRDG